MADAFTPANPSLLILQGLNESMIDATPAQVFTSRPDAQRRVDFVAYSDSGAGWPFDRCQQPLDHTTIWLGQKLHR